MRLVLAGQWLDIGDHDVLREGGAACAHEEAQNECESEARTGQAEIGHVLERWSVLPDMHIRWHRSEAHLAYATDWRIFQEPPLSDRLDAGGTDAIEHHFVPFEVKATRRQLREIGRTAGGFKHPLTGTAAKVMVMLLAGDLVPCGFPWQGNGNQPAFFYQRFQGTVDGRHPHPWRIRLSGW